VRFRLLRPSTLPEGYLLPTEMFGFDVKCKGKDTAGNQIYYIWASGINPCSVKQLTLMVFASEGPLSPSIFSIGPGSFTISTNLIRMCRRRHRAW
jgi:hypothetical protein